MNEGSGDRQGDNESGGEYGNTWLPDPGSYLTTVFLKPDNRGFFLS